MTEQYLDQFSTLQSLSLGNYYPFVSVGDIKKLSDTGIGTFEDFDGEMIMFDGVMYNAKGDGSIEKCSDEKMLPYCAVTQFRAHKKVSLNKVPSLEELNRLLSLLTGDSRNLFCFVKAHGSFASLRLRSEYKQESLPYENMIEALETKQTFFEGRDQEGTLVGLYCPEYMKELNTTGWHFHYVNDELTLGGHVLELEIDSLSVEFSVIDGFRMHLPSTPVFNGQDLGMDRSEDIEQIVRMNN